MDNTQKKQLIKKLLPGILGLVYAISPIDIIPDIIAGIGWLDDISVLGIVTWWYFYILPLRKKKSQENKEKEERKERDSREHKKYNKQNKEDTKETQDENNPYKILGIEPNATKEEIKTAYTKLAAQYHPDKVQHLGDEFKELAHKKFISIQKAYDLLK